MANKSDVLLKLGLDKSALGKEIAAVVAENSKYVGGAILNPLTKSARGLKKELESISQQQAAAMKKIAESGKGAAGKAERTKQGALLKAYSQEAKLKNKEFKATLHNIKMEGEARGKQLRIMEKTKDSRDKRKAFWGDLKSMAEGDSSGVMDRLRAHGVKQQQDVIKGDGKMGAMGELGAILNKIGPAVAAIGAIAAGFAAAIKFILDADAAAKDFNKVMYDAGVNAGDMYGSLSHLYGAFSGPDFFMFRNTMNVTAEDMAKFVGTLRSTGASVEDLDGSSTKLRDTLGTAATYSSVFGIGMDGVAKEMGQFSQQLGENLESIKGSFEGIFKASEQSGNGAKRFYGMMQQVTAGMTSYNVRLVDTANLLSKVGKVLGPDGGVRLMQGLTGKAMSKSVTDRHVQRLMAGPAADRISGMEAEASASDFLRKVGTSGQTGILSSALQGVGAGTGGATSGAGLVAAMKTMTADQKDAFTKALADSGMTDENLRQVFALQQQGVGGAVGSAHHGSGAQLALDLASVEKLLGKEVHKATSVAEQAFLESQGYTGDTLQSLLRVSQQASIDAMKSENAGKSREEIVMGWTKEMADKLTVETAEERARKQASDIRSMSESIGDGISTILAEIRTGVNDIVDLLVWGDSKKLERQRKIEEKKTDPAKQAAIVAEIQKRGGSDVGVDPKVAKMAAGLAKVMKFDNAGQAEALARQIQSDAIDSDQRERLRAFAQPLADAGVLGSFNASLQSGNGQPEMQDMVMQVGPNGVKFAQRVDPGDVGVFTKPGGAIRAGAGGSGGGASVHNYHLYGEGPGVLNTITRAQQAGVIR